MLVEGGFWGALGAMVLGVGFPFLFFISITAWKRTDKQADRIAVLEVKLAKLERKESRRTPMR